MHALSDISCKPCNLWYFTYPMTYFNRYCWHFTSSLYYILEEKLKQFTTYNISCHMFLLAWREVNKYTWFWRAAKQISDRHTQPFRSILIIVLCDWCINSLAPELSAQCTVQKTWDLNGHLLLCMFLADDFRWHLVSQHHCVSSKVHNSTLY